MLGDGAVAVHSTAGASRVFLEVARARILQIDWDADSLRVRAATAARELVWFDGATGRHAASR